ncbi:MAG TPA: ergothioneine biosynthesis protein EgtB [Burkholderiales bacterium]|nr:ergothioneine biosynthesis protein EgtB [Burkholderiales bacterium]
MHALLRSSRAPEPVARFGEVRQQTEALCDPLETDDYQVQSVIDTSPPKWHLAHVTWFFETFLLKPYLDGYRPLDARYEQIFNSYYNTVGPFHPRPQRHTLSRPTVDQVYAYRAHVDTHMAELMEACAPANRTGFEHRLTLGLNHEQQHQELLVMDVKRNFFANPLYPVYSEARSGPTAGAPPVRWLDFPGGIREIGHGGGSSFSFDNEQPRHKVFLRDYRLASRPVTNGEYLEFVESGGYTRPELWLSDGWSTIQERRWLAPLYWTKLDGVWHEMTLSGMRTLEPSTPVCHLSYYEADAYARWQGARLPTEPEWEAATSSENLDGNFVESGLYHPRPAAGPDDAQWFGDVWEWTASPYSPYPGYRPLEGALGEYNGKFMANQYVLRGGCCATPLSHMRATYRNFFYPHDRWPFTGLRLASDG